MVENDIFLRSLDLFKDAFPGRINQILKSKEEGKKIVGTLCLVDENKEPMRAIAERYLKIPCSCMYPNDRRINQIMKLAEDFNVDGVVYYTLQFCHGYNIEKYRVAEALKKADIPLLSIETDYSEADTEQIKTRVDAFLEMME